MAHSSSIDTAAQRLMSAGRFRDALPLAERAVVGARTFLAGHALLAHVLLQLGRAADAERVVAAALELPAGDAEACNGLAYVSLLLGRHDRANRLYRQAAERSPDVPHHWYNLACSERSLGRLVEAERACDRGIAVDAAQYPTYLLRSELRVQSAAENHIEELRSQLTCAATTHARAYLGYALAKELDDVGRYDEAFGAFAAAARARRSQLTYDVASDEQMLRRIAEAFPTASAVRGAPNARDPAIADDAPTGRVSPTGTRASAGADGIFIVGLPRSGTTLVERILSGLPGVRSNGETDNFSRALSAAARQPGDMFERVAAADPAAVAAHYARLARTATQAPATRVIEKLPTNYLYLGAIRRALPMAKILWVSREPLDSCFAMFRTLFGHAYPFTYDFAELARYHAAYRSLMNHWRAVLGDSLHEIVYEDLVRDPQLIGERMARHCEVPWERRAVDIETNRSVSLTASASQVRRPIYGTSSGHWRRYRRHLEPLIGALRDHGVELPDDA